LLLILRIFFLFAATWKNSQSARCASAADHLCTDVDMFIKTFTILKQILRYSATFLYHLLCVFRGLGLLS